MSFIETDQGNRISRDSIICGSQNIVLGGQCVIEKGAILRGDLRRAGGGQVVAIAVGESVSIGERVSIRPPFKTYKEQFSYYPMKIGNHVHIGHDSVVEAASIGQNVTIGCHCVIGRFAVIKDHATVPDGTIIPAYAVVY